MHGTRTYWYLFSISRRAVVSLLALNKIPINTRCVRAVPDGLVSRLWVVVANEFRKPRFFAGNARKYHVFPRKSVTMDRRPLESRRYRSRLIFPVVFDRDDV